jgi:hypothetical protein
MKYTLLDSNNGEKVLAINKRPTRCPFTPPFPVQRMGGVSMEFMPCSTICPHVSLKEEDGVLLYLISCGGSNMVTIELEDEEEDGSDEEPKPSPFQVV